MNLRTAARPARIPFLALWRLAVLCAAVATLLALAPGTASGASYVVDTTDDDAGLAKTACTGAADDCSLRGAITNANAASTPGDLISFDAGVFPGGTPATIVLGSSLPSFSGGSDTIDGTGAGVIIDGASRSFSCVVITSASNTVKGLQITNCQVGINLPQSGSDNNILGPGNTFFDNGTGILINSSGAEGNTIIGNRLGTNTTGTAVHPDGGNSVGVSIVGTNNAVGGTTPAERNILSGNTIVGVTLSGDGNIVTGNYIGTDVTGTVDVGNGSHGVNIVNGSDNRIGGETPAERNIISGNNNTGVRISAATGTTVIGNYIGTDVNGTSPLGSSNGVTVGDGATGNTIGGTTPGEANLISGNTLSNITLFTAASSNDVIGNVIGPDINGSGAVMEGSYGVRLLSGASNNTIGPGNVISDSITAGVQFFAAGTTGNILRGNLIGTDLTGTTGVPNGTGVLIDGSASGNTIGGTAPGDGNVIAFNTGAGVEVDGTDAPSAVDNDIRGNSIHSNTSLEIDNVSGGNIELPPPNITNTLFGTVSGFACSGCEVDVFSDNASDARFYEGSVTAAGDGSFTFVNAVPFVGASVTATNTDATGNTSELATSVAVDSDDDGTPDGTDDDDDNDGLLDTIDPDPCRVLPEDFDSFEDTDGCPDTDNDSDGVCDADYAGSPPGVPACSGIDSGETCFDPAGILSCPTIDCSNVAEDYDGFKDSDGCPEPDNDNDSFPDATDTCPGSDAAAGPDGMLGSPEDLNHNGIQDGIEVPLTSDDSVLTFEDYDGVLDGDGCHDSPGDDFDGDGLTDEDEVFVHLTDPQNGDTDIDLVGDGLEVGCGSNPNDMTSVPERVDGAFAGIDDDGNDGVDEALPAGAAGFDCDGDGYTGSIEDHVYSYAAQTDGDQKTCQEYDLAYPNASADIKPSLRWPSDVNKVQFPLDSFNRISVQDLTSFLAPLYYLGTDVGTNPGDVRWDLVPGPGIFSTDINVQDLTALIASAAPSGAPPMLGGVRAMGGPACPFAP